MAKDSASPAFRRVGDEAEKAGKKTSAFGSLTAKAMGAAAGAIAGVGIVSVLGNAVSAASNLNETVNKTNVIFGQNASKVRSWAQNSAQSFGLSQQAALEAASGFGNMLTQLGYTGDAALKASTSTVKLAADLGSFNNLDTGDVLDRIGAAMRGEYDSLQLLIPNINAARVEQEAMAATGKTNASALTAQEKAAATLAIVTRDGAAAQDDFAETSDGLANSQKILNAEWQDAQARLGELLVGPVTGIVKALTNGVIPAFEGTVGVVGDAVEMFTDLPGPVKIALSVMGGFALLRGPLSGMFDAVMVKALSAKDAIAAAATNVTGLKTALGGLAASAATLVTISVLAKAIGDVVEFTQAGEDAEAMVDKLDDSLRGLEGPARIEANQGAIRQLREELEGYQAVLNEFEDQNWFEWTFWGQFDMDPDEIADAKESIEILQTAIANLQGGGEGATGSLGPLGDALAWVGSQATVAGEETAAAAEVTAEATEQWLTSLQSINEGFVEPLSIYQGLLGDAEDMINNYAHVAADATTSATDSWEDYVYDAEVSLADFAATLDEQIANQENWRTNLVLISQRGGTEVAQILANMGIEGAQITADMATATEEDFQHMRDSLIREANLAGSGATAALDTHMAVMAAVGASGGRATAQGIARELGIGVADVLRIARQYGINLASGINPILSALDRPNVHLSGLNGFNTGGGFADGGYTGDGAKFEPKGVVHGGEFVFTKEQTRKAGVGQLEVFAKMLDGYAAGGFVSTGSVPHPSSTAPYRLPISTAGDATMKKAYDEVVTWLAANLEPPPSAVGGSSSGLLPIMAAARQYVMDTYGVMNIGGYSYRNIAGTNTLSDHALGKAIDIMTTNLPLGWAIANDFAFGPAHSRFRAENVIWQQSISSNGGGFVGMADRGSPTQNHRDHVHVDTYELGTNFVPQTGPAILHRGEAVIPADVNAARGRPIDLSDSTIERLAQAMIRGAGAAISHRNERMARDTRSALR